MKTYLSATCALAALFLATPTQFADSAQAKTQASAALPHLTDWPAIKSPIAVDPAMEARIKAIVANMTLEQKIGQMTQPDTRWVTPEQVRRFYIGSVLNGGGAWPDMQKHASVQRWVDWTKSYHDAAMQTDMATKIPLIWGTDAVHGHNNVFGATLFPHNIGLGAANDPALMQDIGRATAKAVRATGITWVFAPTVAVVQDQRWGRTYESYSADPALVKAYGAALVQGLQGNLSGDADTVASVKHYMGDGGTYRGKDQGENRASRDAMINIHGQGFYGALGAGVQTVMASYNSWDDAAAGKNYGKMHGSKEMLTDVLKDRMGFDGFVISDWNAIEQVPGCTTDRCPQAINAGVDMIMVSEKWEPFIANTVADVKAGRIPMSRIDDAVTRIVRVKMRSGLFNKQPHQSVWNGKAEAVEARDLARRAVSESLVLLKNEKRLLPLARGKKILVVGDAADSFSKQTGGWSRTWQGDENVNADFGTGETLLSALKAELGDANVSFSAAGEGVNPKDYSAVIAVLGENPYAEMKGDIVWPASLQHSKRYPQDLAVLQRVSGKGVPVVTVLYSGRTVYANDLINASNAFVAAWLPGTEARGITDVLLRGTSGQVNKTFKGRLSFAWPSDACATGKPLYPMGYGLTYAKPKKQGKLPDHSVVGDCEAAR